jgi:ligand-binding sensor domain-containing protein/two-component sensor histidine kinase
MLWIGTELGVSVYDGYDFINYQYSAGNETIGRVLCITEDRQKGIWIGGDKGLFLLRDGAFQKITLKNQLPLAIEALLTDAAGNIWIGDLNALYKITPEQTGDIHKNSLSAIQLLPFAGFNKRVYSIAIDKQQNIYTGSYDGIYSIPAPSSRYEVLWKNADVRSPVTSVTATSPDSIYWNCLDKHPAKMIRGNVSSSFTEEFIGRTVFTNKNKVYALTTNGISEIKEKIEPVVSFGNTTNNAVTALVDAEENIWIGSWEGLQKFQKITFRQYAVEQSLHKEVFSMLERKNGELLFGSNRGLLFSKKDKTISPAKTFPALFPDAEVMCLYEDSRKGIWAGSGYQGISHYMNNQLKNWKNTGFLKDNNCEALYPAGNGKIFACTENGVTLIDPDSKDPLAAHYPFQKKYSRYPELFGCFQTGNSGYWFYGSQGLYILRDDVLADDSIEGIQVKNLYINKIVSDKKGNIWVATLGKGLLQCHYRDGKLLLQQQYDKKRGSPSDVALSVAVDKNDNVWWGDYISISELVNPGEKEQLTSFSDKDGLLPSYYQTLKLEQQKNGVMWGLTSMGAFSFHPDSISRNSLSPNLLLNRVGPNGSDSNYLDNSSAIFSYTQNSLQFQFVAVCLTSSVGVRYAYRLKELDSNWIFTNDRSAYFNFLQPGHYTFELKASNNNNVWTETPVQYNFTILPPFWQTWWFRTLAVLLVAGLVILVFRSRIIAVKNKAAIKQQMAELEAKAIRAQMNPHFIFNSLNAIQESIVLNDYTTSYQYLSKFSKLLRQVLNNSEKNFIPLRDEIEMNRLYLELESLRFKHSFNYTIDIDPSIDAETLLFPSLMLQPFIENAIWHGLMHKDGEKKLTIQFYSHQQQLKCIIEDNGIGREKAAHIKKQKLGSQYFESKGTDLALQRMQLLKESGASSAELVFEDLYNSTGDATGTRVIIKIPSIEFK